MLLFDKPLSIFHTCTQICELKRLTYPLAKLTSPTCLHSGLPWECSNSAPVWQCSPNAAQCPVHMTNGCILPVSSNVLLALHLSKYKHMTSDRQKTRAVTKTRANSLSSALPNQDTLLFTPKLNKSELNI